VVLVKCYTIWYIETMVYRGLDGVFKLLRMVCINCLGLWWSSVELQYLQIKTREGFGNVAGY